MNELSLTSIAKGDKDEGSKIGNFSTFFFVYVDTDTLTVR